ETRIPELSSGDPPAAVGGAVPSRAACPPQAWPAAAAVVILHAALGLDPDAPNGRVTLRPGIPLGALSAPGLRTAGAPVDVTVDAAGRATVSGLPQQWVQTDGETGTADH
ncbi:hypothetical protein K1W54_16235, partial [Micromonospora sp. CPCC 205371]|nr:hypothetical protein [Micromonospora sp. CPCC 205371]